MRNPRVGIIGAGQLGRMMALAGYPLGIQCHFLDTQAYSPGGQVAPIRVAALDDERALGELATAVDVLTFDIENVSVAALQSLQASKPVHPNPALVAEAQDRISEKRLFDRLGIPTARYVEINTRADLERAARDLGFPIVLKARRLGYDGRGQRVVNSSGELEPAWLDLGEIPAIAEGWVEYACEVSLIGVGNGQGDFRFYPLTENRHRDGMLESSIAPYVDAKLQRQAEKWMLSMLHEYDYRGVLTIEFFLTAQGLIANEIAPRVHNSGHWTIEGATTSQFENHLRAILGLPLGSTEVRGVTAMRNLIGQLPPRDALLGIEGLHLHDYGKTARPGRKLGHCTVLDRDRDAVSRRLQALESLLERSHT